ncbi:hypothetical protein [Mesorhizobium sp.]|uniref:hypothetical protein n=1 Tax=Mesorhizobium sp. TaxID=1871066 RepID=UPI000FEA2625|nr:hypothetical protein [Mesorhizobium sp.]RWM38697.1 MAG: hypothetical protein EOR75_17250 [Mesorhizobium sp.]
MHRPIKAEGNPIFNKSIRRAEVLRFFRVHLSEMGIVTGVGTATVAALIEIVRDETDERLPRAARFALTQLTDQIELVAGQLSRLEREIVARA